MISFRIRNYKVDADYTAMMLTFMFGVLIWYTGAVYKCDDKILVLMTMLLGFTYFYYMFAQTFRIVKVIK